MSGVESNEDRLFREWRETFPEKHWSKTDLGACRLGWDAGRAKPTTVSTELLESLKGVVAISDRDHVAWHRAHAAISAAEAQS